MQYLTGMNHRVTTHSLFYFILFICLHIYATFILFYFIYLHISFLFYLFIYTFFAQEDKCADAGPDGKFRMGENVVTGVSQGLIEYRMDCGKVPAGFREALSAAGDSGGCVHACTHVGLACLSCVYTHTHTHTHTHDGDSADLR